MPIKIPDALPATDVLEGENIFVMTEFRAMHQDIRPLKEMCIRDRWITRAARCSTTWTATST